MTVSEDTADVLQGFEAVGVDYLVKPVRKEEVLVRIRTHLERARLAAALAEKNGELERANKELQEEIAARQALSNQLSIITEREAERWGIEGFVGQSETLKKIL